ncbi:MAG TPA: ABC transporter transmembrane domain-containing protein, partial [Bryobacteraceae bacterium]|nr:ABC transporter transmembrane domain-containing protein [Bryobacteraceae bacterium]
MSEERRVNELGRLLRYSRPYTGILLLSVVLMAIVGAAQALTALLIGPVFDRVLNPASADTPVLLFTVLNRPIFLSDFMPGAIHNVWTMVAVSILALFLIKGLCDYAGNYLVNYVGFSAVTDLRQQVFDRVLHQDAHFFESNSTARVMSSIMNDLEKIQVAMSHILADLLRQSFTALGLLLLVLRTDWKLALVSLTVLPFVLVPTVRLGRRLRRTTRRAQDDAAEVNQVLQETLSGQAVVKSFGAEEIESNRFRDRIQRLRRSNLRYVAQQAIASPLIEFFGAATIVGLLYYARLQIKSGLMTTGEFTSFVIALLMLYEPVKRLTGIHNIFQQALGASQKVFEYLERDQGIKERPGAVKLAKFEHAILFDDVGFRYPGTPDGFLL